MFADSYRITTAQNPLFAREIAGMSESGQPVVIDHVILVIPAPAENCFIVLAKDFLMPVHRYLVTVTQ